MRLSSFLHLSDLNLNTLAIKCGDPTSNLSAKQIYSTGSAPIPFTYLITVPIICEFGYDFIDGSLVNNISCTATGKWSKFPVNCAGRRFKRIFT